MGRPKSSCHLKVFFVEIGDFVVWHIFRTWGVKFCLQRFRPPPLLTRQVTRTRWGREVWEAESDVVFWDVLLEMIVDIHMHTYTNLYMCIIFFLVEIYTHEWGLAGMWMIRLSKADISGVSGDLSWTHLDCGKLGCELLRCSIPYPITQPISEWSH